MVDDRRIFRVGQMLLELQPKDNLEATTSSFSVPFMSVWLIDKNGLNIYNLFNSIDPLLLYYKSTTVGRLTRQNFCEHF